MKGNMKAAIKGLLISSLLLPLLFAAGCKETKQEAGKPPTFKSKEVIITNEIIIPKNPGEYQNDGMSLRRYYLPSHNSIFSTYD